MKYVARLNTNIDRLSEEQLLHKLLEVRGVNDPTTFLNLQEEVIGSLTPRTLQPS